MPWWDQPAIGDEIDGIVRELRAAVALASELPPRSRDRGMVLSTSAVLLERLAGLLDKAEQTAQVSGQLMNEARDIVQQAQIARARAQRDREGDGP